MTTRWPENLSEKQGRVAKRQPRTAAQFEWYRKLYMAGFEDLETFDWHTGEPNRDVLLGRRNASYSEGDGGSYGARYYELASEWLHERDWAAWEYEQQVWELHCEGATQSHIARVTGVKHVSEVSRTLTRLRVEFLAWAQGWRLSPRIVESQREEGHHE